MEKDVKENYEQAGQIWTASAEKAKKMLKPDIKLLDLAETIEKFILDELKEQKLEGGIAFPINLSINNQAAHATPSIGDLAELKETDLLKVDLGVHVNGYIADGAFSFNASNDWAKMIEANEKALEEALALVKPGLAVSKIGETIQDYAEKSGFKPIENLTGHGLEQRIQHAPPTIPNVRNNSKQKLEGGMAIAIEPFFTNGRGFVADSTQIEIYSLEELKPIRDSNARKILEVIGEKFETLPFAERQLAKALSLSEFQRKVGLRELVRNKILHAYPILQEQKSAFVSQAEKTVIIDGEEAKIIN